MSIIFKKNSKNFNKTQNFEKKLLNIKINKDVYEIISNNYVQALNPKCITRKEDTLHIVSNEKTILPNIILEEGHTYPILLRNSKEIYILCCLPDFEQNFIHVDITNTNEITIGTSSSNNIEYKNPFIAPLHAKILKINGKWTIENFDKQFGLFVNDFPIYNNTKNIFNGDIIFIMGLQIIMIKNSLYINNPLKNMSLDDINFTLSKLKNVSPNLVQIKNSESDEIFEPDSIDYYYRSPRIIPQIKTEKVIINEPPELQEDNQKPMLLALGSSIAISVVMIISFSNTIKSVLSGTATAIDIIVSVISTLAMLAAMLLIPVLNNNWERSVKEKYEIKRQNRYKSYLDEKNTLIESIKNKQRSILCENFLSSDECIQAILSNEHRLWERKIQDDDFLTIRLGLGKVPLDVDITYPQEKFTMVDDNLVALLNKILTDAQYINNAPITLSFIKNRVSAIVSKNDVFTVKYIKNLIVQLITFHSYEDLRLVFLLNEKTSKEWDYVKMLPHVWNDLKQIRFFADNYDDMNEISKFLVEEFNNRTSNDSKNADYNVFKPYYLIITDDYKKIEDLNFVQNIFNNNNSNINPGFSLLCVSKNVYDLPSSCKTFIYVKDEKNASLFENGMDPENQLEIKIDTLITIFFEKIVQKLANIPIRVEKKATSLPSNFSFLEMYNVGNINQLDILGRWRRNDSTLSLRAPIGIDNNGIILSLDAHEKFHGPHGLIAGSTGSGKSEFIMTYILSLAVNYHPDDVSFLLIDYKGGGLAGAFQKNNIKLPHLVGTITNIEKNGLKRSLTSIQSELRRRQIMFNNARNLTNEGTIDIYKYQKLYHDGIVKEPIAHLFIICDEFAELKQQQPDFMDELVSVSRIGRSLGVHLILATQKPSGIVNDQIRSNSKFAICLKVQNTSDSHDVILRADAAYLKNPGQFYLKVGQNEYFVLGQSGWAGSPYIESNMPVKQIDSSVEFVSNTGLPIKKIEDLKQKNADSKGEQLTNILKYIYELAKSENIKTKNLWLDPIPENLYLDNLKSKYNFKESKNTVKAVIGEYDDPFNQSQGLVEIDFSKKDNVIIYGSGESGKETLLSTLTYELMSTYSTNQVQMYILDFGTEALKIFRKSPHVGDIMFAGDDEKIDKFFDLISKQITTRKQLLSDYNGDYNLYISEGNVLPLIVVMINNYETFYENCGKDYDDLIMTLTREGPQCGVLFVVNVGSTRFMRYRLTSNFNNKIALQLNDESEYYNIFTGVKDKRPSNLFGRGLIQIKKQVLEFQTAKICEDTNYNKLIGETIEKLNIENEVKAPHIPTLPDKIELDDMLPYLKDISNVPLGLIKKDLEPYIYNFSSSFMTVFASSNLSTAILYSNYILEEVKTLKDVKINILDTQKSKDNLKEDYDNFIKTISEEMKEPGNTFSLCAIIGINKLASDESFNKNDFNDFLKKVKRKR